MIRRVFLSLTLATIAMLTLPAPANAETLHVVDTNDGYLNLRSGPGTNYGIVQRMYGGTAVNAGARSGNWRQVFLPDGRSGWASERFLTLRYYQERYYDHFVAPTNDGYLNLRSGPGTGYGIIQRMYAGQGLVRVGTQGNWYRVRLPDGTTGWAHSRYMY